MHLKHRDIVPRWHPLWKPIRIRSQNHVDPAERRCFRSFVGRFTPSASGFARGLIHERRRRQELDDGLPTRRPQGVH